MLKQKKISRVALAIFMAATVPALLSACGSGDDSAANNVVAPVGPVQTYPGQQIGANQWGVQGCTNPADPACQQLGVPLNYNNQQYNLSYQYQPAAGGWAYMGPPMPFMVPPVIFYSPVYSMPIFPVPAGCGFGGSFYAGVGFGGAYVGGGFGGGCAPGYRC